MQNEEELDFNANQLKNERTQMKKQIDNFFNKQKNKNKPLEQNKTQAIQPKKENVVNNQPNRNIQIKKDNSSAPKNEKKQPVNSQDIKQATDETAEFSKETKQTDSKNKVKITFLGGVGEIGKNMTVFETANEIIVIDAGLSFPTEDLPGIDVVVPDISYLIANKKKVKAIILTHGHEDHIGALPFVLSDVNVPVYGSRLTLALVESKLREYPKITPKLVSVKAKNVLKIGDFTIEFIKVNHSIPDAVGVIITSPAGNIVHTGDFKIDFAPIDGSTTDLTRFGELGRKGINLLLCESTNICREGYSMSESTVGVVLDDLFQKHQTKRLFVATFASNIHRLQQILNMAEKYGRKVVFTGRSMINISEVAMKVGELSYNKQNVIDVDKIDKFADKELLIISTGSQGEPMSALTRMAMGDFNKIKIGENDTIIISASPIPGNERNIYKVINQLFKKGADVIYDELADVHVSGHACKEEIKTIHALTQPKFLIPVHGEYRHLKQHKELAMSMGMKARDILLADLGMQAELSPNGLKQLGYVKAGVKLVDGMGVGNLESTVLKERKQLSEDGFCVAVMDIDPITGDVDGDPFIITRGVVYNDEAEAFTADLKTNLIVFVKTLDIKGADLSLIKSEVRKFMSSFIFKRTKRRPMTFAIITMD